MDERVQSQSHEPNLLFFFLKDYKNPFTPKEYFKWNFQQIVIKYVYSCSNTSLVVSFNHCWLYNNFSKMCKYVFHFEKWS
jgi:hypothetical protein